MDYYSQNYQKNNGRNICLSSYNKTYMIDGQSIIDKNNIIKPNNKNFHDDFQSNNNTYESSFLCSPNNTLYFCNKNNEEINNNNETIIKLQSEISQLKNTISNYEKEKQSLINQINSMKNCNNLDNLKYNSQEKEISTLRKNLLESKNLNQKNEEEILSLRKKITELKNNLYKKDNEIDIMSMNSINFQREANNLINDINSKADIVYREKQNLYREYKKENNELNEKKKNLEDLLENEKNEKEKIYDELNGIKRLDFKKEKLLEMLFDFYNKIKMLSYYNKSKEARKESLEDVIYYETLDEFKKKLDDLWKKYKKDIELIKMKFGKCLPCDIACCTSQVDRLKFIRNMPKDAFKDSNVKVKKK